VERVAGVLPRAKLLEGLARAGRDTVVLEVMLRDTFRWRGHRSRDRAPASATDPATPLLVVEEGSLRGMITFENLAEFIVVARQIAR